MRAEKYELARAIDQVKSVLKKNAIIPALEGILVRDGYFTGSNTELTVQVRLEALAGESFIIPPAAIDMIKNLPDGEVEVTSGENDVVQIRAGKVKHKCQSFPVDSYAFYKAGADYDNEITLPGEVLMDSFSRVAFASSDKGGNTAASGVYLEADGAGLNIVALDGKTAAWDSINYEGESGIKAIIPKAAVLKLASLGIIDRLRVSYNQNSIIFRGENFTVSSRLIDGKYFNYRKFFEHEGAWTVVNRKELVDAMGRARLCAQDREGVKKPAFLDFGEKEIRISLASATSEYTETIYADGHDTGGLRIGFDPNLVLKALKAFSGDDVTLEFYAKNRPVYMREEGSPFIALVAPVNY